MRYLPLLCTRKFFGLGGSRGVVSPGEKRGETLVLQRDAMKAIDLIISVWPLLTDKADCNNILLKRPNLHICLMIIYNYCQPLNGNFVTPKPAGRPVINSWK